MESAITNNGRESSDLDYQHAVLPSVSRTFALTIPQLPPGLREPVANAYLLCRIADTVEDEPALSVREKERFHDFLTEIVVGRASANEFARKLYPLLSTQTSPAERDLIRNTARVIAVTHAFSATQRAALERCVRIMCEGMPRFQRNRSLAGLADREQLDQYCYYVAGVVGEMLTELFCDYRPDLAPRRQEMMRLAVSFGQGLQMTNILKDVWEDRARGVCWLPRTVFLTYGFELADLTPERFNPAFGAGLEALIGIAHGHLDNALSYTLIIPPDEQGIRRFCLWALGLAVLTLDKLRRHPSFRSG